MAKGRKGREGTRKGDGEDGGPLCGRGVKGEGRKRREGTGKGREGGDVGPLGSKGVQGREEGKGRSNGELTLTPEP